MYIDVYIVVLIVLSTAKCNLILNLIISINILLFSYLIIIKQFCTLQRLEVKINNSIAIKYSILIIYSIGDIALFGDKLSLTKADRFQIYR